jgi:hypothetical protein
MFCLSLNNTSYYNCINILRLQHFFCAINKLKLLNIPSNNMSGTSLSKSRFGSIV